MENVDYQHIESPEPYIAIPSLQYISFCMDSEELRDMYANLLANSMNKTIKNQVHPGYVEIIKQLSPDEAKILKGYFNLKQIPIVGIRYKKISQSNGIDIINKFSDIGEQANCEFPYDIEKYMDNLERLGLIESTKMSYFTDDSRYNKLKIIKK